MSSTPLFGKDSIPHRTSSFLGLIITAILWLIFTVGMIFIPVGKKQKLKPVQIVLSSTPVEKKIIPHDSASTSQNAAEEQASEVVEKIHSEAPVVESIPETAPAPAPEPAPVVEAPKPVAETPKMAEPKPQPVKNVEPKPKPVEKKQEAVKNVEPKTAPEKTVTKPVPEPALVEDDVVLSKSVEELMAEQMNAKSPPNKSTFDWSTFDDESPADTSTSSQPKKVLADNKLEGSSGSVTQTKPSEKVTSSKQNEEKVNNDATSATAKLGDIKNTTPYTSSSGGSIGTVKAQTAKDGTGKTLMTMTSGSARSLIDPVEPIIKLSEEIGSKIAGSVTVEIKFTVLADGNIGDITFTPEALLPPEVRKEIKSQIIFWRFERSDTSDTAKFEYTIKKQ